jgi:hypothetical protein
VFAAIKYGQFEAFFVDFLFIDFGCDFGMISLGRVVLVYVRRDLGHGLIHLHHKCLFNFLFLKFPHFLGFHVKRIRGSMEDVNVGL